MTDQIEPPKTLRWIRGERGLGKSSSRSDGYGDKLSPDLYEDDLETILKLVLGLLRDAIESTVENVPLSKKQDRCFLPKGDLERIIDSRFLARLFRALLTNSDIIHHRKDVQGESRRNNEDAITVDEVVDHCIDMTLSRKAILALFLYQERWELLALFMQWVRYGGDNAPYDHSMPLSRGSLLDKGVPEQFHNNLIRDQQIFTPVTILDVYRHNSSNDDHLHFIAGRTDVMSSSDTVSTIAIPPHHTITHYGHPINISNLSQVMATALQEFHDKNIMDKATTDLEIELEFPKDLWKLVWKSVTGNDKIDNPIARLLILELPNSSLAENPDSEKAWMTTAQRLLLAKIAAFFDAMSLPHDDFEALHLHNKPKHILVLEQEVYCFEPQEHGLLWKLCDFQLARGFWGTQRANIIASREASELWVISWPTHLVITPAGTYRGPEIEEMASSRADLSSDVWFIDWNVLHTFVTDELIEIFKLLNSSSVSFPDKERRLSLSTDGTLVGTAGQALASSKFNMYEHRTQPPEALEEDFSDVASLLSRGDASDAGSSATLVEYQQVATDVIAKAFLGKGELSLTYRKAIKIVGTDRFLRNNARLLQDFSADLQSEHHLPSETLVVRFLSTTVGRRLVSAAICDEIHPNKGLRPQRQLDQMEDKKLMLNRFLGELNSAVQSKPSMLEEMNMDDVASIKSASDGEPETMMPTDEKLESLEETVRSFMSGRAIETYQKKLQQWLDLFMQPSQGDVKPVDPIGNTTKEASEHPLSTELKSQPAVDFILRDVQDKFTGQFSKPTAPTVKDGAPLTVSQKGNNQPVSDELEEEVGFLAAKKHGTFQRQLKFPMHNYTMTFPLSLPLLVDRILRYLPVPYIEPPIPEGKIRVRWISVGFIIC